MSNINHFISENKERFISELSEWLKIPSISANPKYGKSMLKAADWLIVQLEKLNFSCKKASENYRPLVLGEWIQDSSFPTVLIYGHYDVQPPEPLDLWETPAFEPTIRDNKIFARGVADDKGQVFIHLKAMEYVLGHTQNRCNFKVIIEGEEEVGSENLPKLLGENADFFENIDAFIVSDTCLYDENTPIIVGGLRGLAHFEIKLTCLDRDVHSGVYGGIYPNAIYELVKLLAGLKDKDNQISIPNFYEDVYSFSEKEIAEIERDGNLSPPQKILDEGGAKEFVLEKKKSIAVNRAVRPTLDINGIFGGYIGEGSKTIIPSSATAKISLRLVAGQTWSKTLKKVTDYLKQIAPKYCQIECSELNGGNPLLVNTHHKSFEFAKKACEKAFGKPPLKIYEGASIPILAEFKDRFNLDPIMLGFGLNSDHIHSPNENFKLTNLWKGIETIAYFYQEVGKKH